MKRTKKLFPLLVVLTLTVALPTVLTACSDSSGDQNVVYEDMEAAYEASNLLPSNIGLFSKTVTGDSISYGECGSGVIFDREGDMYYALTAAHVVSDENAQILVFTINTEMKTDNIPGIDYSVLSQEVYESMYTANVEYVSSRDDLAVISFSSEEDLSVVTIADEDPEKDDRIMCIANPQNDWFAASYGRVISGIEKFGEAQGFPSNAMRHTAYMHVGSSGGGAINERMLLAGITPGGYYSADGKTFKCGTLIPASEIKTCLAEWNQQ